MINKNQDIDSPLYKPLYNDELITIWEKMFNDHLYQIKQSLGQFLLNNYGPGNEVGMACINYLQSLEIK